MGPLPMAPLEPRPIFWLTHHGAKCYMVPLWSHWWHNGAIWCQNQWFHMVIIIMNEFQSNANRLLGRLHGHCHVSCDVHWVAFSDVQTSSQQFCYQGHNGCCIMLRLPQSRCHVGCDVHLVTCVTVRLSEQFQFTISDTFSDLEECHGEHTSSVIACFYHCFIT